MWSQVEPKACTRSGILAPSSSNDWPEAIDVRLKVRYIAEATRFHDRLRCQGFAFPSPVVKDREKSNFDNWVLDQMVDG